MGRAPCRSKESVNRGAWTATEDRILSEYINNHGEGLWLSIPKKAGLNRCGKSCRLRWLNYLRPDIKRGNISPDEEDLIIRMHRLLGNRWSLIAGRLPGRTDNEIKNYWKCHLSKRFRQSEKLHRSPAVPPKDKNKRESRAIKTTAVRFSGTLASGNAFMGKVNNIKVHTTLEFKVSESHEDQWSTFLDQDWKIGLFNHDETTSPSMDIMLRQLEDPQNCAGIGCDGCCGECFNLISCCAKWDCMEPQIEELDTLQLDTIEGEFQSIKQHLELEDDLNAQG